ncbi:hypothetical protein C8R44DRAFT_989438 [Mycena epipterygia]|nr:hypothetical protein C8R44DRAFT_989438 [Mycena epipterygia]
MKLLTSGSAPNRNDPSLSRSRGHAAPHSTPARCLAHRAAYTSLAWFCHSVSNFLLPLAKPIFFSAHVALLHLSERRSTRVTPQNALSPRLSTSSQFSDGLAPRPTSSRSACRRILPYPRKRISSALRSLPALPLLAVDASPEPPLFDRLQIASPALHSRLLERAGDDVYGWLWLDNLRDTLIVVFFTRSALSVVGGSGKEMHAPHLSAR